MRAERTSFFPCMGVFPCAPFFTPFFTPFFPCAPFLMPTGEITTGGTTRKEDLARLHGFDGTNALAVARSSATSREHVTIRTISSVGRFGWQTGTVDAHCLT